MSHAVEPSCNRKIKKKHTYSTMLSLPSGSTVTFIIVYLVTTHPTVLTHITFTVIYVCKSTEKQ